MTWQLDVIHMMCIKHALIGQVCTVNTDFAGRPRAARYAGASLHASRAHAPHQDARMGQARCHFCPNPPQQRKTQYVVGIGNKLVS